MINNKYKKEQKKYNMMLQIHSKIYKNLCKFIK